LRMAPGKIKWTSFSDDNFSLFVVRCSLFGKEWQDNRQQGQRINGLPGLRYRFPLFNKDE
jgi:hypothetical protein